MMFSHLCPMNRSRSSSSCCAKSFLLATVTTIKKNPAIYSLDQSVLKVHGFMIVKIDSLKPRLSVPDFVSQFFSKAMRQSPNRKHRFEAREIAGL